MKIASAEQMHHIDAKAINTYGIPEIALMENAGREASREALNLCKRKTAVNSFCILAGCGNNGGDGFVAARHLINAGAKVKVFIIGNPERFTASAKINHTVLVNMKAEIYHIISERDWNRLQIAITFSDCIIDALLGTGIHGELRENIKKCIAIVNSANRPVLSIDVPSGINADTGAVNPTAIKASATLTYGLPKIGLITYPGSEYTGKIIVNTIGLPQALLKDEQIKQEAVDSVFAKEHLQLRPIDAHKGSCGKVLVIAGSLGLTGAAVLTSSAVLRMGAGISTLASAESLYDILAMKSTEVMTKPLPEIQPGILGMSAVSILLELAKSYDAVLIGPGLGRNAETCKMVREFAVNVDKPLILDADAIYAFSQEQEIETLKKIKYTPILTPHLGEMANLLHISIAELKANLWEIARKAASECNAIFVVKSEKTLTVYPKGNIFVNTSGNQGMATAGSGDVLAGAIAGLVSEGSCGEFAAPIGVYLHGVAGDLAAQNGQAGLIAGDILANLPKARREIDNV